MAFLFPIKNKSNCNFFVSIIGIRRRLIQEKKVPRYREVVGGVRKKRNNSHASMSEPLADGSTECTLNSPASCLRGNGDVIELCPQQHGVRDAVRCHMGHCDRSPLRSVVLKRKGLMRSQRRRKYLRCGRRIEKRPSGDKPLAHSRPTSGSACVRMRSFLSSVAHSIDDGYSFGVLSSCARRPSRVELKSMYGNEESDDPLVEASLPSVFIKRVSSFRLSRMGSSRESRSSWSSEGMLGSTLLTASSSAAVMGFKSLTAQQSEDDTELVDSLQQPKVSSLSLLHCAEEDSLAARSSSVSRVAREDQHTPRAVEGVRLRESNLVGRLGFDLDRGNAATATTGSTSLSTHRSSAMEIGSALRDFRTPLSLSVRLYGSESYLLESTLGGMAASRLRSDQNHRDLYGCACTATPIGQYISGTISQRMNATASMHTKRSSFIAGVTPLALRSLRRSGVSGGLLVSPKISLHPTSITPLVRAIPYTCDRTVYGHPLTAEAPRLSSSSYEFFMGDSVRGHCAPLRRQSVATSSRTVVSSRYLRLQKPVDTPSALSVPSSSLAFGSRSVYRHWRGGAQQSTTPAAAGRSLPFLPTAALNVPVGASVSSVACAILEELAKSSGRCPKTLSTPSDPRRGEEPVNCFVAARASRDVLMSLRNGALNSLVSPSPFRCGTFLRSVCPPLWRNSKRMDTTPNERVDHQKVTSETRQSNSTIESAERVIMSREKVSDQVYNDDQFVSTRASSMPMSCGEANADAFDNDGEEKRCDEGLEGETVSGPQPSSEAATFIEDQISTLETCEDEESTPSAAVTTKAIHTDIPHMEKNLIIQNSLREQRKAVVSGCNSLTVELLNSSSSSSSIKSDESDLDFDISAVAVEINHDGLLQGEGFVSIAPKERSASCECEGHAGEINLTTNEYDVFEDRDRHTLSTDSMPPTVRNVHVCVPSVQDVVVSPHFSADPIITAVAAVHADSVAASLSSLMRSATQGTYEEANDASLSSEDVCDDTVVTSFAVAHRPSSFVFPSLRPALTPPTRLLSFVDTATGPTSVNTPFSSPPRRYTRRRTAVISRLVFEDTSSSDEDTDANGFMLVDMIDGQPRMSIEDRRRRSRVRVVVPRETEGSGNCNKHTVNDSVCQDNSEKRGSSKEGHDDLTDIDLSRDNITPEEVTVWHGGAAPKRRQGCPCIVM